MRKRDLRSIVRALAVAVVVSASVTLGAHHGTNISYDRSKQWTATATVTEFKYVNPHAQLFFDVSDPAHKGHYNGELAPNPAQLLRNGWTRKKATSVLYPGVTLTVTVAPSRAGGNTVLVLKMVDEHGQELLGGGPNAGGPEPATR